MVIRDLAVVGYAGNVRSDRNVGEKRKLAADDRNDLTGGVLHIVRDELAVCAWIGQELLFVKRLNEIECLLGSEAVVSVCLALQGSQIVELRRIDGFCFLLERRNDGLLFLASTARQVISAAILFASSSVLTFSRSAVRSPLPTWTLKYFSFWNVEIFPSRSTSIARVGVWTRPTTSFL